MSELFTHAGRDGALALPATGSLDISSNEMPWLDSGARGFWIKPLFEENSAGLKTWLMKVDAGAFAPLHAHAQIEQIYVLQGSFFDQHKTYGPGEFIIRAAAAMHSAGSQDGALVMLFYSPATTP